MTVDLKALAKRHVEFMTVLGRPTGHCAHCFDPEWPCNIAVLVRVALAARLLTDCWDVEHREIMAFVATDDESRLNRRNSWQGTQGAEAVLRAALADLDR